MSTIEVKDCTLISFNVITDDRRAFLAAVTSLGWIASSDADLGVL